MEKETTLADNLLNSAIVLKSIEIAKERTGSGDVYDHLTSAYNYELSQVEVALDNTLGEF